MTGYFCMDFQAKFLSFPVDAPNHLFFFPELQCSHLLAAFPGRKPRSMGKEMETELTG